MSDSEIDRILSERDEIMPSSGFAASVMEAVRREASAPPPIPFPWLRALPGVILAVVALALIAALGVATLLLSGRAPLSEHVATTFSPFSWPSLTNPVASAAAWTAGALLVAWVAVKLSVRPYSGSV